MRNATSAKAMEDERESRFRGSARSVPVTQAAAATSEGFLFRALFSVVASRKLAELGSSARSRLECVYS